LIDIGQADLNYQKQSSQGLQQGEWNIGGISPIMCASQCGHDELVKYLLSKNVNISLTDQGGNTALGVFQGNGQAYYICSQSHPSVFTIKQSQVSISPTETRKRFHVFAGFGNYSNGSSVIVKCNSFVYIGIGGVNPDNYPAFFSQAQIVITPIKIFTADYGIDLRTVGPQSIKIAPPTDNTEALHTLSFCNTKGYTPLDILSFCNKFKIRCFVYYLKMERFITNKDNNIVFNPNSPAFVYYFNDEHIYLINDKQMRHSLLNNNSSKSDIISLLSRLSIVKMN
jgi:hypothetical protein